MIENSFGEFPGSGELAVACQSAATVSSHDALVMMEVYTDGKCVVSLR